MSRNHEIYRALKLTDVPFKTLPGGYNSEVTLRSDGNTWVVMKIINKEEVFRTEEIVEIHRKDIEQYHQELLKVGVPTVSEVEVKTLYLNGLWFLIVTMPYVGVSATRLLQEGEAAVKKITENILRAIEPGFHHHLAPGSLEVKVGVDPKPDNYVTDDWGQSFRLVDITPPRFRKAGEPLLEFYPLVSEEAKQLAYFRNYDIRGILMVLQTQLCRLKPLARKVIKETIFDFAQSLQDKRVTGFFTESVWEKFTHAKPEERVDIVNSLQAKDLYTFREIACQLVFENPMYDRHELDQIFRELHLTFDLPGLDKVERVRSHLSRMIHSQLLL